MVAPSEDALSLPVSASFNLLSAISTSIPKPWRFADNGDGALQWGSPAVIRTA
jgi:hypothetical protein